MYCLNPWISFLCYFFACNLYVQGDVNNQHEGKSVEYTYFSKKTSWNTASEVCQSIGARLVTITSQNKVDMLKKYLYEKPDIDLDSHVWIGLHRIDNDKLGWSDVQCSEHNESMWSNFQNNDTNNDHRKKCFIQRKDNLKWHKKPCEQSHTFLCEKYITSNSCKYVDMNRRLSIVPMVSASTTTCQTRCDKTEDCVMVAPYCTEHCILAFQSSSNSSTQLYNKVCSVLVTVNESELDVDADGNGEPSSCKLENQLPNADVQVVSRENAVLNCLEINTHTVAMSKSSDSDQRTTSMPTSHEQQPVTVTMTTCILPDATSADTTPCVASTVVSTVVIMSSPVKPTLYMTPSPVVQTHYMTPSPVIQTHYMTPSPVIQTHYMTPSPVVQTHYMTPSPVIQTHYMTPSPVVQTHYMTPSPVIQTVYITPSPVISTLYMTPTPVIQTVCMTPTSLTPTSVVETRLIPATPASSNVFCTTFNKTNVSQEKLQEVLDEIVVKLKVDTKNLSTTTRKKTSAPDPRRSSTAMGYTAGLVMLVPFALMVLVDVPRIFRDLVMNKLYKQ